MDYSQPYLGTLIDILIDRPLGSRHPNHGYLYPVNYGFVPGTQAPDGDELDAYVLGPTEPLEGFRGRCIAIIHRLDDDDDKLVVCADADTYTDEQIQALTHFQEQYFKSEIIREPTPTNRSTDS